MNENIKKLVKLNPKLKLTRYDNSTKITLPWNDKSIGFKFKKGQKLTAITDTRSPPP